ncbi:MAG: hypothetical protein SNJ71_01950, partial [Bacteroidales bacterium]
MKMNTSIIFKITVNIALFMLLFIQSQAQLLTETRRIERAFRADADVKIELINKYGMMHVEASPNDSVKVLIEIVATATETRDLTSIMENIDVQFVTTSKFLTINTIFLNPSKIILKDLKSILGRTNAVRIDYTVYVPKNNYLNIENKYGDIYCNGL